MSNTNYSSLTLSNLNKKKNNQNKKGYLVSSFSSKFFQNLENNLEKESKGTPRNYFTESSKQSKSIKKVNSGNKSISQSTLNSHLNTLITGGKSSSKSPLRNSKKNILSKSNKDMNNKTKYNPNIKSQINLTSTQSIVVKKANFTKHKKSISLSQKSNFNSRLHSKLKNERNNSFNNSKYSIKNKLQNITPINNNNISKQLDYSIIKNNSIEPSRPYTSRINPGLKKQSSILKKNLRNNSKKNFSSKNNLTISDNFSIGKNSRNSFSNHKIMNMEILKNNLSPNNNLITGKHSNVNNLKRGLNKPIQEYLDKKNLLRSKNDKKLFSMTEGNDFSNNSNNKKEKNVIDSPIKHNNKESAKNHRPKSKSFFANKLFKSDKIQEISDKYELKQISSLTELKSGNNSLIHSNNNNNNNNNSPISKDYSNNININQYNPFNISTSQNIYSNKLINNNQNIQNSHSTFNNHNLINNNNHTNYNNHNINNLNPNILNTKNFLFPNPLNANYHPITPYPIIKKIMKIDSCTSAGYSSPGIQKTNQDSFFIEKDFLDSPEHFFLGVCDGHGINGHLISDFISNTLPLNINSPSPSSITSGFLQTNNDLITISKIDCNLSGTTCVSLLITLKSITCANLGDSRAVLAKCENGYYSAVNLSRDQKPSEQDEMKRILQYNGRISQYFDEESRSFIGPKRIWLKNSDIPGLAMTRSFGDLIAHSVGVIAEPEIGIYDFGGCEKFVIVASDGVWEFIDSEESVHIVKKFYENGMDACGAVNALVKEAYRRWRREEDIIDDITAIVVFFD